VEREDQTGRFGGLDGLLGVLLQILVINAMPVSYWQCMVLVRWGASRRLCLALALKVAIWLILPVVICLSQRLSHACLSINCLYCETANGSLNQL
jgi:hypothetical protein